MGKIKWARINESNRYIKNTFDEVIKLISNDLNFNENVWGYKPNLNKNPIKSKEYVDKLQSMMKNDYSDSRMVLYDILRRSNSYYRCSITELRDALDHIVKSLFLDEEKAIRDIICAHEHIRRAAVESIHDYVLSKLSGLNTLLKFEKGESKKLKLLELISKIKREICVARYNKGSESWYLSVNHFYNALDIIGKIGE